MAKYFFIVLWFALSFTGLYAQDEAIAQQYFNKGDYEKAIVYYEKLYKRNPRNRNYLTALVTSYQQAGKPESAEEILLEKLEDGNVYPILFVEAGYNYQLMDQPQKASQFYDKAVESLEENPNYAFAVGNAFKGKSLLDYAIKTYKKGMELNPKLNFSYDLAYIYGEQGDIENMYEMYLDLMLERESLKGNIKRNLSRFISNDLSNENNELFKKILLQRSQTNPNLLWNELLSWLFIQQGAYKNAFAQEKAIYKRSPETSLNPIIDLAQITSENEDYETTQRIYEFIITETNDLQLLVFSKLQLTKIALMNADAKDYDEIDEQFNGILTEYGTTAQTLQVQIEYAKFLAFTMNKDEEALGVLDAAIKLPIDKFSEAQVKMTKADVLVYGEKFNQALIYYSQVQKDLKNDVLGQQARFKVAQTSFYKGDFEWAETQLKVLKSSTSQLIANDALELKLLISDNKLEDSTQTALKLYAKADLLAYQKNNKKAIALLEEILVNHKGESIEDEALLKQAFLYEQEKEFEKAAFNYKKIIEFYPTDILMDNALYQLALLYRDELSKPEEAKKLLERIIFEHQDSVYFLEARKAYREMRGDNIE
ncbi:tetratricopeptide repeat protein [Galbibacter mesophilus]|uniref:tetratricopeptide repeat protein n=1 Tax=Galbibacter mesophilus TaxID=379069 RepID=UPI0019202821|nr:tetratricopeptide repeat protein [Galbibacter mesophilus]MCM5664244.1 tetratricopeptide repeat protein [Galbibacter mesophilus]